MRTATICLAALCLALPRSASGAPHPDYDLVSEAETALTEGDLAGAEQRLSRISGDSVARADADLVREKLDRERAPALTSRSDVVVDDQPFARWLSLAEVRSWMAPRLELGAGIEAGSVFQPAELGFDGATVSSRLRLGAALLDVGGWAGIRRWFDGAETFHGELSLALRPAGKLRGRLGARRADELTTFGAVTRHIHRDGLLGEVEVHSLGGFSGALRGDLHRYSDENFGVSASAWCTLEILERPAELALGYAGGYGDTASSHWRPLTESYYPYFTPLISVRHGPLAALRVRFEALSGGVSAHYAFFASERDPTTVGYYTSRRAQRYVDLRSSLDLTVGDAVASAGHRYQLESYYAAHILELELYVRL
jgi:hypothetical protein